MSTRGAGHSLHVHFGVKRSTSVYPWGLMNWLSDDELEMLHRADEYDEDDYGIDGTLVNFNGPDTVIARSLRDKGLVRMEPAIDDGLRVWRVETTQKGLRLLLVIADGWNVLVGHR